MDELSSNIAKNLKTIRESRKLSLDKLAQITGVSKGMLSQIEHGNTSPSISTVWKISNGLKISFTSLLKETKPDISVLDNTQRAPMLENDQKYRLYPLFPFEARKKFEIYYLEMAPSAHLAADGHSGQVEEYIFVQHGQLTVTVDAETYIVRGDQSITFNASKTHMYTNAGSQLVKAIMMIYYEGETS